MLIRTARGCGKKLLSPHENIPFERVLWKKVTPSVTKIGAMKSFSSKNRPHLRPTDVYHAVVARLAALIVQVQLDTLRELTVER